MGLSHALKDALQADIGLASNAEAARSRAEARQERAQVLGSFGSTPNVAGIVDDDTPRSEAGSVGQVHRVCASLHRLPVHGTPNAVASRPLADAVFKAT